MCLPKACSCSTTWLSVRLSHTSCGLKSAFSYNPSIFVLIQWQYWEWNLKLPACKVANGQHNPDQPEAPGVLRCQNGCHGILWVCELLWWAQDLLSERGHLSLSA